MAEKRADGKYVRGWHTEILSVELLSFFLYFKFHSNEWPLRRKIIHITLYCTDYGN